MTVEDEDLRRLQEVEDDRLDALDRRDREGELAPAEEGLFGGSGRGYSTVEATERQRATLLGLPPAAE